MEKELVLDVLQQLPSAEAETNLCKWVTCTVSCSATGVVEPVAE